MKMNLEGQRFGKLVVIKKGETRVTKGGCKTRTWICRCDCGRELIIPTGHLRSGHTKSCGCLRGIDITGQKFGKLTAIKRTKKSDKTGNIYWYCECECGGNIITQGRNLRKGLVSSCGCVQKENARKMNFKHGMSRGRIYEILCAMKSRCYCKNDENYKRYGERGIEICDEWRNENGFKNFYEWSIANGYQNNLTIDRIDVDGNYCPENCRWVTQKQQMQNTRRNRYINYEGKIYSISELSEKLNLTYMQTWHKFRNVSFGMDELSEKERRNHAKDNK
jgi:hypothetical protein